MSLLRSWVIYAIAFLALALYLLRELLVSDRDDEGTSTRESGEVILEQRAPSATPPPPASEPTPEAEAPPSARDDLKVIEGIGPKMEQLLNRAGITTFRQLAERSPEELRALLQAANAARFIDPETWAEQARLAAEGRWEELRALQGQLKGGRRVS